MGTGLRTNQDQDFKFNRFFFFCCSSFFLLLLLLVLSELFFLPDTVLVLLTIPNPIRDNTKPDDLLQQTDLWRVSNPDTDSGRGLRRLSLSGVRTRISLRVSSNKGHHPELYNPRIKHNTVNFVFTRKVRCFEEFLVGPL